MPIPLIDLNAWPEIWYIAEAWHCCEPVTKLKRSDMLFGQLRAYPAGLYGGRSGNYFVDYLQ